MLLKDIKNLSKRELDERLLSGRGTCGMFSVERFLPLEEYQEVIYRLSESEDGELYKMKMRLDDWGYSNYLRSRERIIEFMNIGLSPEDLI